MIVTTGGKDGHGERKPDYPHPDSHTADYPKDSTNPTYMNIPIQVDEEEHNFDNPIYTMVLNDAHPTSGADIEPSNTSITGVSQEQGHYDDIINERANTCSGDTLYSDLGPVSNQALGTAGTDYVEHKFDNPIYGNETDNQYAIDYASPTTKSCVDIRAPNRNEVPVLSTNGKELLGSSRNSAPDPYETIVL